MIKKERRREERQPCNLVVGAFLSQGPNGPHVSPVFDGWLMSLSRRGAGIALTEVMAGQTHLVYGPMESAQLQFNIVFTLPDREQPITLAARPVWLNKEKDANIPPFRLGVEFLEPLPDDLFRQLNRQFR